MVKLVDIKLAALRGDDAVEVELAVEIELVGVGLATDSVKKGFVD